MFVQVLQQEVERLEVRAALVEEEAGRSGQLEEEAAARASQLRDLQEKVMYCSSVKRVFFGAATVVVHMECVGAGLGRALLHGTRDHSCRNLWGVGRDGSWRSIFSPYVGFRSPGTPHILR